MPTRIWDNESGREVRQHLCPGLTPNRKGLPVNGTRKTCSMPDCNRPHKAFGLCNPHWQRYRNGQDLTPPIKEAPTLRPRGLTGESLLNWIDQQVIFVPIPNHPEPCKIWTGHQDKHGYGRITYQRKSMRVHVLAWQETNNRPVPAGLVLDHEACDTPSCVQVLHLVPKTNAENVLRGNSLAAQNARKTHCKNGHPLEGENLRVIKKKDGTSERKCITCAALFQREYRRKRQARTNPGRQAS